MIQKLTISKCPVCYQDIPAAIGITDAVWLTKQCKEHGEFTSMLERQVEWYNITKDCKNIYDGYLIDVTSRCNLKCKYCYHDNNGEEKSLEDIVLEAYEHRDKSPFILTGGEPTMHKDLPEIIKSISQFGQCNLLTNGIKLCDEKYLDKIIESGLNYTEGIVDISLSFHKEAQGRDLEFLELCRKKGIVIWTAFYVIDELSQIEQAVELFKAYSDVVNNFRIKAASNLWAESKADNKIFVSDMIKYLSSLGKTELIIGANQKVSYAQVLHEGLDIKLISWYDVTNVDLQDIECAPYYRALDGTVNNLVTTAIINEGIKRQRGMKIRRVYPCDIQNVGELWEAMVIEGDSEARPNVNMWCNMMYRYIQNPDNHIWIAEVCGETVGFFAGSTGNYDPITSERYIIGEHFYIKPEHRDTVIGKKLHNAYKRIGHKLGISRVIRRVSQKHSKLLLDKGQKITEVIVEEDIGGSL
jgi:organic radical activating enzyme/GNAT superfamily N-acetyltransferase